MTGKSEMSTAIVTFPRSVKQDLLYRCSACGADRGCDCNAPAIEKAAAALARSPEKSDRAIAKEIGTSDRTVNRARTATHVAVEGKRVGLDGKARRMPDRRSTEDDEADDPSPENMVSREGLRNLIKFANSAETSVRRWPKIIKNLDPRRFDDEGRDELRKTLERLRRDVNAALSAIDTAGRGGAVPHAGDMPGGAGAEDPQHRQFSGVYAVRQTYARDIAEPAFIEPAPHQREFPIIGHFLERGPRNYAVLSVNPKRYRTTIDAMAAVEAAASERAREGAANA